MLSSHFTHKNGLKDLAKENNLSFLNSNLHQNSMKSNWSVKNASLKQKQNNESQKHTFVSKVNDQNCSYNANSYQNQSISQKENIKRQSSMFLQIQNKLDQYKRQYNQQHSSDQPTQMINLKKKIKKCTDSQNFYRQKVTFKKKVYKFQFPQQSQQDKQQVKISVSQGSESFFVYRDSQIFKGQKAQQLRSKIVPQRMDNDVDTDDEQVEKFVKRISRDLLEHVENVRRENRIKAFLEGEGDGEDISLEF